TLLQAHLACGINANPQTVLIRRHNISGDSRTPRQTGCQQVDRNCRRDNQTYCAVLRCSRSHTDNISDCRSGSPAASRSFAMQFPNESKAYRAARNDLLKAEIDLRRRIEKVAALRRSLPAGGEVAEDYVFDGQQGKVKLSQLFERGNTLVAYSFMYGPKMQKACPMCTAMLDGLNGNAQHIGHRTNLVVIAKSPLERILAYARERGWLSF